jgi:hypothetical protein
VIAKTNYSRLSAKRYEILILLDGKDTHGRDGCRSAFFAKGTILAEGKLLEGTHRFDGILLLVIALKPNLTVGM